MMCPCCMGRGQISGPRSVVYEYDPDDAWNRVLRNCDECEGTGVVSTLRSAALMAEADQHVQRALNKVMGLPGDPRD